MTDIPQKKSFYDICMDYEVDNDELQIIADNAKVAKSIVDAMFVGTTVMRADAEKVLAAFYDYIRHPYTLKDVSVPTLDEERESHERI